MARPPVHHGWLGELDAQRSQIGDLTTIAANNPEGPPGWLRLSDEIEGALRDRRPVVALESTVIAHGLPRPRNLELGLELEAEVHAAGATPGTVAVIDGVPRIGLDRAEIERIANDDGVVKLSTREIAVAVTRGSTGATTVAATAWLARAAGIAVFATGGIGGVHRGTPLDTSPDLEELSRTPIIVVCAGAKSILDLPATREALETLGVLVAGWRTDEFPAFYTRTSGLPVDVRVESAAEVAAIWRAHRRLNAPGGLLLCAPVPADAALPDPVVEDATERAVARAGREAIRGKTLSPFLLREIADATGGASLEANIALLRQNARVAAEVAREISRS